MWRGLPLEQYQANVTTAFKARMLRPGIVWTDEELKKQFGLTDRAGRATTASSARRWTEHHQLAISDMVRYAGHDAEDVRAACWPAAIIGAAAAPAARST
jgi:hypothetical protein